MKRDLEWYNNQSLVMKEQYELEKAECLRVKEDLRLINRELSSIRKNKEALISSISYLKKHISQLGDQVGKQEVKNKEFIMNASALSDLLASTPKRSISSRKPSSIHSSKVLK